MTNAETRESAAETFSREEKRASGAQVGKKESRVTSSKETKDEETKKSGLGGVLAKAFGFDRRKNMPAVAAAETRETSPPVSAEAGETNDERDERPESNDDEDVRRSGREGDAPEPARGGLTASDQMARLAALKEEEEARLARLNREARFESRESKTAREALLARANETTWSKTGPSMLGRATARCLAHWAKTGTPADVAFLGFEDIFGQLAIHNRVPHKRQAGDWRQGAYSRKSVPFARVLQEQLLRQSAGSDFAA